MDPVRRWLLKGAGLTGLLAALGHFFHPLKAIAAEPESGIRIVQGPLAAADLLSYKPSGAELLTLAGEERIRVLAVPSQEQYDGMLMRLAAYSLLHGSAGRENAPFGVTIDQLAFAKPGLRTALFGPLELLLAMPVRSETIADFYNSDLTPDERGALASAGRASGGSVTAGTVPGTLNLEEATACSAYVKAGILAYENGRFTPTDKVLVARLPGIQGGLETGVNSVFYFGGPKNDLLARQALFRAFMELRDDVREVVGAWFGNVSDKYYGLCYDLFEKMYSKVGVVLPGEKKPTLAAHAAAYAIANPSLLIYIESQRQWLLNQAKNAAGDSRVVQELGKEIYAEAARLKEMLLTHNDGLPEKERVPGVLLEPTMVPLRYREEGR